MSKKNTTKTISAKKALKQDIKFQITAKLKDITTQLGLESKGITKAVENSAKKLAKKLTKEMKAVKALLPANTEEIAPKPNADSVGIVKKPAVSIPAKPKLVKSTPKALAKTTADKKP